MIDRVPPNNIEAEQGTLGSMMLQPEALHAGLQMLKAADFYRPNHQDIFMALEALERANQPVDLITLTEELRLRGSLEECGGTDYLMALVDSVPTAANIAHYAEIVAEKATLRRLIEAGTKIAGIGYDSEEVDQAVSQAQDMLLSVKRNQASATKTIRQAAAEAWDWLEQQDQGMSPIGIPFGLEQLDRMTFGAERTSQLFIVAARPSCGKTVMLNRLAANAGLMGRRVIFFTFETSARSIAARMIYNFAKVNSHQFRNREWEFEADHMDALSRMGEAAGILHNLDDLVLIRDIPEDVQAMRNVVKAEMMQRPIDAVLVDYLQIVPIVTRSRTENRNAEVQQICRGLKGLTQELQIPVVAAAQLKRAPGRPTLHDLREGGNQEAEADKVMIIHPCSEKTEEGLVPTDLIIAKHKDGPTGTVSAYFNPGHLDFTEVDFSWQERIPEPKSNTRNGGSRDAWWLKYQ